MNNGKLVSIISTAYNEEACIESFLHSLYQVTDSMPEQFEIIICENGSSDQTREILQRLESKFSTLKVVYLVRNFGHQGGILAALDKAKGDSIIMLDADGQHPPDLIPEMIRKWNEGYQVVNTSRVKSGFSIGELMRSLFYWIMLKLTGLDLGDADFRLIDKTVADNLKSFSESEKFIRGLVGWQGYKEIKIPYSLRKRMGGKSKFSFFKLLDFAIQGICSFSTKPLRFVSQIGVVLLIPSGLGLLWHLYIGFSYLVLGTKSNLPPGWLTLSILIMFFGSIQLLSIGILAEYIGKIYHEVKNRPAYLEQD